MIEDKICLCESCLDFADVIGYHISVNDKCG